MAALGPRKRVPVPVSQRLHLSQHELDLWGRRHLPLRANVRKAAGIEVGDRVAVDLEVDRESRSIEPPRDLAKALGAAGMRNGFAALSPSHQKEYVLWLDDAKRPETRVRRLDKIVEKLREKLGALAGPTGRTARGSVPTDLRKNSAG